jgi:hypothetical protein
LYGHPGKFEAFWAWRRAILNKVGKWQWRWGLSLMFKTWTPERKTTNALVSRL